MKKSNIWFTIYRYSILLLALLISSFNFNLFMKPIDFVTGGTPGFAIIINHLLNIPTNYVIYFAYMAMFIVSFFVLGKKSLLGILIATVAFPLFVTLTGNIIRYIIIDYNDLLIISIISGIISGITNGFIYKMGFASSGLSVLGPLCHQLWHVSIAFTNFVINIIIVLVGGYLFGPNMICYAIIFLYFSSIVANRIIIGISNNKVLFIRSIHINKINELLYDNYNIESYNLDVLGGYTKESGFMSFIVIPTNKYAKVISAIRQMDDDVFYNVLDCYEVERHLE